MAGDNNTCESNCCWCISVMGKCNCQNNVFKSVTIRVICEFDHVHNKTWTMSDWPFRSAGNGIAEFGLVVSCQNNFVAVGYVAA